MLRENAMTTPLAANLIHHKSPIICVVCRVWVSKKEKEGLVAVRIRIGDEKTRVAHRCRPLVYTALSHEIGILGHL